jgi:hypothetical protein
MGSSNFFEIDCDLRLIPLNRAETPPPPWRFSYWWTHLEFTRNKHCADLVQKKHAIDQGARNSWKVP